jgi:hypothetical protein
MFTYVHLSLHMFYRMFNRNSHSDCTSRHHHHSILFVHLFALLFLHQCSILAFIRPSSTHPPQRSSIDQLIEQPVSPSITTNYLIVSSLVVFVCQSVDAFSICLSMQSRFVHISFVPISSVHVILQSVHFTIRSSTHIHSTRSHSHDLDHSMINLLTSFHSFVTSFITFFQSVIRSSIHLLFFDVFIQTLSSSVPTSPSFIRSRYQHRRKLLWSSGFPDKVRFLDRR